MVPQLVSASCSQPWINYEEQIETRELIKEIVNDEPVESVQETITHRRTS